MTVMFPNLPADHPANQVQPELLHGHESKFEPKLSFDERCAAFAAMQMRFSLRQVALAFSINRRTASRIGNLSSKSYKAVHDEYERLGRDTFISKYFTEDVLRRIQAVENDPELNVPRDKVPPAGVKYGVPNERANGHRGISTYKLPEMTHRIETIWLADHPDMTPGWYTILLDVEWMAGQPFGDVDKKTHLTSQSALQYARWWLENELTA